MPFLSQANPLEGTEISFGWLFVKTILAMIFIVGLAIVFLKYVLPKLQMSRNLKTKNMEILDRLTLEPRKHLYVVRVGEKASIVGTSDNAINKIMDVDLSLWEESE